MDENIILELAAHMRDFGYWRNTVLFFHGKSYSDFDRSYFNAKCQERNRTLIGEKTLPTLSCASYQLFSQEMPENPVHDDPENRDDFDDFDLFEDENNADESDLEWYKKVEEQKRYHSPNNSMYICTLSKADEKDYGSLMAQGIPIMLYEKMGGKFYTDCNEPDLEELAPYSRKFMRAHWRKYRGGNFSIPDDTVALLALEKFLEKYDMKVTEELTDVECSTLFCIRPKEGENKAAR